MSAPDPEVSPGMPPGSTDESAPRQIAGLTEHLFRRESARLISILTGIFGIARLQLVEDVVQEALLRALKTWPYYGVPQNPSGWLLQTARRQAIDVIRREKNFAEKHPEIVTFLEQQIKDDEPGSAADAEFSDDQLKLIFTCCHPVLAEDVQTALALKTICGFSPAEIGRAFLITEAAAAKRLTRARQRLQEEGVRFEIPSGPELTARLAGVHKVLYLLFNEGYKSGGGERLVREELCHEAIRLGNLLVRHPAGEHPNTHALLALMHLTASRLAVRLDSGGNLLLLGEQNRAHWDHKLIQQGLQHLAKSTAADQVSQYHLEATIAACHSVAQDEDSTNWTRILTLYDRLLERNPSPVVALNRAVAVARVHGPEVALRDLRTVGPRDPLANYYLFHSVLGDLQFQRQRFDEAIRCFRKALSLTESRAEQDFLERRIGQCTEKISQKKSPKLS